nr:S41 family peptidase [Caldilineaceae bacterium]
EWVEDRNAVRLIEPFENQPAWNAGLRRNDLVIAIDGEPVSEMADLNEAISKIKGPKGSSVVLTVERPSRNETFDVTVVRDVIQIPIVFTDTYGQDKDIAYIRLSRFSDDASRRVRDAIDEATKQNLRGLVFDLRGNPGGLLREAVRVSSLFLQDERVLIERFSDGKEQFYDTEGRAAINVKLPIVLLVNEGSASASEIVAGALQDTGRAVLIGTTTFGKGSVQLPHTLSDGSMMRVTIARWYTPADRSIDGTGLDPDIEVEISDEQIEADEDPQLDRAIELLETGQ